MAGRRSSPLGLELVLSVVLALVVLPLLSHGAPVQDAHAHDLQQYSEGCYYNYNHYNEGNRIVTNEPCLNCTCHNKMLMCYLRVCPFTKPIGHDCTVEKREDQCCPIITCPEVRVDVSHNHQLTTSAPGTELSIPEKYGCNIDSKFFPEGAQLPSNPNKPCELCYCIRNRTSCLMQECTLHIDGCQPIYNKGSCCPVRYNCDHENELLELEDLSTTTTTVRPTPGYILTSTASPVVSTDCVHNNEVYADGASITGKNACEHCYCMRGDIVCAVQECEMPTLESGAKTCRALPPAAGECCPSNYVCDDDSALTESPLIDEIPATTTAPKVQSDHLHESVSQEDVQLQEHIDDKIPATEAPETPTKQPSLEQEQEGDLISGQIPAATEAPVDEEDKQSQGEDESPLATTALPIEIATTHKTEDELADTHTIIDQDKEYDSTQAPIETDTKEKDVTTIAPLSEEPQKPDEETIANEEDAVSGEDAPTTAAPVEISKPEEKPSIEEKPSEKDVTNVEDLQKPIDEPTTVSSIEKDEEEDKEKKPTSDDLGEEPLVPSSEAPPKKIDLPDEEEESESSSESSEPFDITTISSIEKSEEEDKEKKPALVDLAEEPLVPSSEAPTKKIDLPDLSEESESSSDSSEPSDITTISSIEKSEEEDKEKKPALVDLAEEPLVPSSESPPKKIDLPAEDEDNESSSESSEPSKETSMEEEAGDKIDEGVIETSSASPVYEMVTQGEDSDISMPEVGDHKTEVGHKDDEEIIAATGPSVVPVSDGEVKDKLPSIEVDSTTIQSAVEAEQEAITTSKPSIEDEKPDLAIKTDDASVAPVESEETSSESEDESGIRPPKKESAESSAEDQKPLEEAEEIPAVVQEVTDTSGKPIQGAVPKGETEPTSQTTALPIEESVTENISGSEESEEEGTSSEEESKEKPIPEDYEIDTPTTVISVDSSPAAEVTTIASVEEALGDSGPSTSANEQPVKEILDVTTVAPSIVGDADVEEEEVKGKPEKAVADATTVAPSAVEETLSEEEEIKGEPEKEITESTTIGAISDVKVTSAEEEEISDEIATIAPSIVKKPSVTEAEQEQTEIEQGSGEFDSDENLDATTVTPQVIKEKDTPSVGDAEIPSAAEEEIKIKPEEASTIKPEAGISEEDKEEPEQELVDSTTVTPFGVELGITSAEGEEPKIKPEQGIAESTTLGAPALEPEAPSSEEDKEGSDEGSADSTTVSPSAVDAEVPSSEDEEPKIKPEQGIIESTTLGAPALEPEAPSSEEDKEGSDEGSADSTTVSPSAVDAEVPSAEDEEPKIKPEQGIAESTTLGAPALEPEAPSSEEDKEGSDEGSADSTTVSPSAVDAEVPSSEDEEPKIKPEQGIAESTTISAPALEPEAPSSDEDKEKPEEGSADSTTVVPSAGDAEVPSAEDEKPKIKPEQEITESTTLGAPALEPEVPSSEEDKKESEEGLADSTTVSPSAVDAEVPSAEDEEPKVKPEQGIAESSTLGAPALQPEAPSSEEDKEEPEEGSADSTTVSPSAVDVEVPSAEGEQPKIKPEQGIIESTTLGVPAIEIESSSSEEDKEEPEEGSADSTTVAPSAVEAEVPSAGDEETKVKPEKELVESTTIAAPAVQPEAPISEEDKKEPEKAIVDSTTLPASAADEDILSAEDEEPKIKPELEIVESSTLSAESDTQGLEDKKEEPQEGILDSTTVAPIAADEVVPSGEDQEVKVKPEEEAIESSTIAASAPELEVISTEEDKEKPQEGSQDSTTVAPSAAETEIPSGEEEKIKLKPEEDIVESSTIAASEQSETADLEQDKKEEKPEQETVEATTTSSEESEELDDKVESKPDSTTISSSLEKDDTKEQQEDKITGTEIIPSSAVDSEASKPEQEGEEEKITDQEIAGLSTIAPSADDLKGPSAGEEEVKPDVSLPEATTISSTDEKSSEEDGDKKEEIGEKDIDRTTISSLAISDEESSEIVEAAGVSGEQSHEIIPSAIPGEGDCLFMDETYANNASVPSSNECEVSCTCANSIVVCKRVQCYEPPKPNNCILDEANTNKCCPQYICGVDSFAEDQRTTTPAVAEDEEIQFTTLASPKPYPGVSDESVIKVEEPVKSSESEEESSGEELSDITTKQPEEEADKVDVVAPPKLSGPTDEAPAPAEESSTPSSIDIELPTAAPEQPLSHVKDEEGEKETSAEGSGAEEDSTVKKEDDIPLTIPEATTLKAAEESVTVQPVLTDIPAESEKPKDEIPVDSSTGLGVPKIDESIFATEEPETESTTIKQIKPETDAEAPSLSSILGADEKDEEESPEKQTESGEEDIDSQEIIKKEEAPATAVPVEQSTIIAPIEGSTIIADIEYQKPAAPEDMSHTKVETELPGATETKEPAEAVSGDKSEESSTEKIIEPILPSEAPVSTILTLVQPPKKTEVKPEISDKKDVFPAVDEEAKPEKEVQPVDQSTEQESTEKDESLSASVTPASAEKESISGTIAPVSEAEGDKDVIPSQPSGSVTEQPAAQDESSEKEEDIASPTSAPVAPISGEVESEEEDKIAQPTIAPITDKIPAEFSGASETTDKSVEEKLPATTGIPEIELDEDNEIVVSPTGAPAIALQPTSGSIATSAEDESEEAKDEITSQTSSPVKEDLTPQIPTTVAPSIDENEITSSEEKDDEFTVSEEKKPSAQIPVDKDGQEIDVTTTSPVSESSDGSGPVKPVETGDEVSVDAEVPETSTIIANADDDVATGAPISPTTIKASVAGEADLDSTEAPVDSIPIKGPTKYDTTEASIKPIEKEDSTESSGEEDTEASIKPVEKEDSTESSGEEDTEASIKPVEKEDSTESSGEEDTGVVSLSTDGSIEKDEDILVTTEGVIAQDSADKEEESVTDKPSLVAGVDQTPSKADRGSEDEPEPESETLTEAPLSPAAAADLDKKQPVDESTEQVTDSDEKTEQPSSVPSLQDVLFGNVQPTEVPQTPEEISPETSKPDSGDQILVDEVSPEIIKDTAVATESSVEQEVPETTEKKPASDEASLDAVKPAKGESPESVESSSEEDKESSSSSGEKEYLTETPSILKEDDEVIATSGKPEVLVDDKQSATDKPISSDEATEAGIDVSAETAGQTEEESSSESEEAEKEKETATTLASVDLTPTTVPSLSSALDESETPAPSQEESEKEPELVETPKEDVKVQTIAEFVTERVEELTSAIPILDVKKDEEAVTSSEELSTSSSEEEEPEVPVVTEKIIPAETPVESTEKPQAPEISEEDQKEETPVTESAIAAEIPIVQSDDKYNTDLPKPIATSEEETPLLTTLLPLFPHSELDLTTPSPALNASDKINEQVPVAEATARPVYASPSTSAPTTEQSTTPQAVTSAPTSHYQPTSYGHVPPQYPTYTEDEYTDEDETEVFGPGTCRYGGKLFVSAQQIPRDDPCDFCFCFRSDIICLQQSCPPPISGCHEEPISGFCCPRYECPVSMATVLNITTSTTTTSTTLPPHFLHHAYRGAAEKNGCHISGKSYKVGDKIDSASGPCMHCTCGGDGQMKCDPKTCSPEPMLRQMIAVVASRRR